jgi:protein tyrosine phosphatase
MCDMCVLSCLVCCVVLCCVVVWCADKPSVQLDAAFKSAAGFLQHVEAMKGRVLIHCVAGVSRSVSIFLMYIMMFHHIKLSPLWNHTHGCRYGICRSI